MPDEQSADVKKAELPLLSSPPVFTRYRQHQNQNLERYMIFDMQIVAHAIAIVNAMRSGQLANLTVMLFSQWMQVARQVEEQS
ncbi:hypothetical protein [Pantoea agglomerans]|uniref:hypothetical protein n=1 Tax=Enterobacter agglomerans TaxID=549 RepID=UPI003C7C51BB